MVIDLPRLSILSKSNHLGLCTCMVRDRWAGIAEVSLCIINMITLCAVNYVILAFGILDIWTTIFNTIF